MQRVLQVKQHRLYPEDPLAAAEIVLYIGVEQEPAVFGLYGRGAHLDVVVLEAQRIYHVRVQVGVPFLPEREIPQLLYVIALRYGYLCRRLVGVRGKDDRYLAVDALGEERHRLGVKGRDEMALLYGLEVF